MYRVNFYLRDPKATSETPLNLFVTHRNERIKLSTGIKLHPELWDTNAQKITSTAKILNKHSSKGRGFQEKLLSINSKLSILRNIIQDYLLEVALKKSYFNLYDLKNRIKAYLYPKNVKNIDNKSVLDYLDAFITDAVSGNRKQINGTSYSPGTISNYRNLRQTILRFQSFANIALEWNMIDRQLYSKFMEWQQQEGFSTNYSGKHAKDLKALMRMAYEDSVHGNQAFRARWFAVLSKRIDKFPLTESEMKILHELNLKLGSAACKARDLFMIGCYTGLRISDVRQINPEIFVDNGSGKMRIKLINRKTKCPVIIPVSSQLHEVLQRYDYHCPKIAEQTANRLIKGIAVEAGIPELKASKLTLHIGRHSFVTHLYHAQDIPMIDIMQITGHTTERNFMRYVNARPEDSARRMEKNEWFR